MPNLSQGMYDNLIDQKNNAYRERDMLVAALSKLTLRVGGDAWLTRHEDADWDDDWRNIVVVVLDGMQMTWHIADHEVPMFAHLQGRPAKAKWDGHSTPEKYERLASIK